MAMVHPPHEMVGKTPVKKEEKSNNNNNNSSPAYQIGQKDYCILCRKLFLRFEAQEHMHSMLHHRELETVLDKDSFHECSACEESSMGLDEYAQHISTIKHKIKLRTLVYRHVKPLPVERTLGAEAINRIVERNKSLKRVEKRARDKKRKKLKQLADQKHPEVPQGVAKKHTVASKVVKPDKSKVVKPDKSKVVKPDKSKVVKPDKSKQVNMRLLKQMQGNQQQGSSNTVFQNKENKASSLQRPPHQRESAPQNQGGRFACLPEEPSGQIWDQPYVQAKFAQSAPQLTNDHNFSFYNQCSEVKTQSSQTHIPIRRPHDTQEGATNVPEEIKWPANSQHDHHNKQYGSEADFTSDHLPQNGAIIFGHSQSKSTGSSESGQEGTAQPASADVAPIRDADVGTMLRQIRRALGLREPCRAEREARRQNSETGVRSADQAGIEKEQPTGGSFRNYAKEAAHHITSAVTTPVQSALVSSAAPASHSGVHPSSITSAKPNKTQGTDEHCESSSSFASDSNETSNNRERGSQAALDSPTSLSRFSGKTTSSEPNLNIARRVRIAHEPGKGRKEAGLKPTVNKLLSLSGTKSKLSWREMNEEMRRKRQEKVKGMPRFGIQLPKKSSTQAVDCPLTEGFHWESLPGSPLVDNWTGLPPLPPPDQDATDNNSHTETQSDSQIQEQPGAAPQDCRSETVAAVPLKVEPNWEDKNGDLRDQSAKKRKPEEEVTQEKEKKEKKKKTKSNKDQDQMGQLLAVSLREDELSHSLQDLDQSLVQARNVLQAAYTEVQRLLLFRQQCTAEVNSLRAKRIEILQGMQGGAAVQPKLSPLSSTSAFPTSPSQQIPLTSPASSISQPYPAPLALPIKPVKQEACQPPPVSCNPDTSQVSPLFPPNLLSSLLLTSPHLAAPTTVTSLKQLCSASANPSPESSARQQEQATGERLKDCVKTAMLAREEADRDSEEETEGNLCLAPEKPASSSGPERDQNGDDAGNESDSSVKMMEPSNLVVIDIDKSDNEETVSTVSVHQEPAQKSVSMEFSSVSTQVFPQNDAERKFQPTQPVKNENVPPVCVGAVDDEEPSLGAFSNHTGPVHGLQVHGGLLYTCSGDNTARAYSLMNRECQAVFTGHTNKVNCLLVSSIPNMSARLYTGSSDQTIRCHSLKTQKCLDQASLSDRVLCLHAAWNILFAGLANGSVASFDLKTLKQVDVFECHGPRGVSCLGTAQEGARRVLLVGSYDSTISVRDAKSGLLLRSLEGHTKTVLCMKVVNDLVFSGSSDMSVHAHNIHTGELVRIYKGHSHAVTSIVILGKVMVTACLDKLVRVYELQSHDRMQVYGGHSEMVMCMAIHKSVIYTGCYDGSVQATKLNLMKNYRCWWQNCTLIFGIAEHLVQHLVKDHTSPNLQMVKCRWRSCSSFFATQHLVRQELPEHMQKHVEKDSEVQP